jgi:hypothetical protein
MQVSLTEGLCPRFGAASLFLTIACEPLGGKVQFGRWTDMEASYSRGILSLPSIAVRLTLTMVAS